MEGLPDVVDEARRRGLKVVYGNLEKKLELEDSSFDWVICIDVLEHLIDPLGLLLEIRRVLNKKGRVIINVPNHLNLTGRIKLFLGSDLDVHSFFPGYNEWDNPHIRFFTYNGIKNLLSEAGYNILEDFSFEYPQIPMGKVLRRCGLLGFFGGMVKLKPSLFAGGFFILAGRI